MPVDYPKTKAEAKAAGAKIYNSTKPCKNGSTAPRLVSNGACICQACRLSKLRRELGPVGCTEENRTKSAEQARAWRKANPGYDKNRSDPATRARYSKFAPPWITFNARMSMDQRLADARAAGMEVDHTIPFRPALPSRICGLHVPGNLGKTMPGADNNRKGNACYLSADEEVAAVEQGYAIWSKDAPPRQPINWQPYVGDALAAFLAAAKRKMKSGKWTAAQLCEASATGGKLASELRKFCGDDFNASDVATFLKRIDGLTSGGLRLERDGKAWRIAQTI